VDADRNRVRRRSGDLEAAYRERGPLAAQPGRRASSLGSSSKARSIDALRGDPVGSGNRLRRDRTRRSEPRSATRDAGDAYPRRKQEAREWCYGAAAILGIAFIETGAPENIAKKRDRGVRGRSRHREETAPHRRPRTTERTMPGVFYSSLRRRRRRPRARNPSEHGSAILAINAGVFSSEVLLWIPGPALTGSSADEGQDVPVAITPDSANA